MQEINDLLSDALYIFKHFYDFSLFFFTHVEDKLTSAYFRTKQNKAAQCGLRVVLIKAFKKKRKSIITL